MTTGDDAPLPLPLPAGLVAVTGDEGSGKTRLLHRLAQAGGSPAALWLDLALPGQDECTADEVWDALRRRCPGFDAPLHAALVESFGLPEHRAKKLFMLSTGSRRKVALAGLLAAGATVTCLDQPFAALDATSAAVLRDFLAEAGEHPDRSWVVADYEADPRLPWRRRIDLAP